MNRTQKIILISSIVFGIFFMPTFSYAADIYVTPSTQNMPCGGTELYIGLNTNGDKVIASDIKFFLQGLSVSNFTPLSGFDHSTYIGTGISTKGVNIGSIYHYINVHQNSYANPLTGNGIAIAKITVAPISGNPIGSLHFYNLSANDEDSNISIGTGYGTEGYPIKYIDGLSSITDGIYNILSCVSGGGGGGGGGGVITPKDVCQLPSGLACANSTGFDASQSYYDDTCCAPESHESAPVTCDVSNSPYNQEITDAFTRGYNLNITNKCPITQARLEDPILRKELAKMISMFTIQVIGIYPDTHKTQCDAYNDTKYLSEEMQFYIKTACQLDLMGLEDDGQTPQKSFNPNGSVPRSEFGTVLSRLIYGDQYNIYAGDPTTLLWYEKHLQALNRDNIMKKIQDPLMLEQRARILLMLERTTSANLVAKYRLVAPAHNGALSLLENVW